MRSKTVLIGLGNILLRDEGLGVHLVQHLQANHSFPSHVTLLDGGTLGLDLLPYLDEVGCLVLVDAVDVDSPPGTIVRWEDNDIPASLSVKMSPHQIGLADLLVAASLIDTLPERVILWGMQPAVIEPGLELSPEVEAAMLELEASILSELQAAGMENPITDLSKRFHGE
jgi:hydrogenase maturation protease